MTILAKPFNQIHIALEEFRIIKWQVSCCNGNSPFICSCVRFPVSIYDLKQGGHCFWRMTQEDDFLTFLYIEAHVVKQYSSICVGSFQTFNLKNLITGFTFHLEYNAWIFSAGRTYFLNSEFLQHLFTTCCLLTFSNISRETTYKLFKLLALFLSLLALVLCLF